MFHHFLNESDLRWLSNFSEFNLTETQNQALITVREIGAIDNSCIRDFSKLDNQKASQELRHLRNTGLLDAKGSGNRTYYVASNKFLETLDVMEPTQTVMEPRLHDSRPRYKLSDLPEALRREAMNTALSKRLNRENAEELIERMCAWNSMTVEELALMLERKPGHISQHYLSKMISKGTLTYAFPEMPNHPAQEYSTVKK